MTDNKPLYLQLSDHLCAEIISGKYVEESRVPSVREMAMEFGVNVNTAMKAYDELARANIIYNKRGMGYFVQAGAANAIAQEKRQHFITQQLPNLFGIMDRLGLGIETIVTAWERHNNNAASLNLLEPTNN